METRRILIVANQTAPGPHLKKIVRERMEQGPCKFMLLVPGTPPHGTWTWSEEEVTAAAHRQLEQALEGLGASVRRSRAMWRKVPRWTRSLPSWG